MKISNIWLHLIISLLVCAPFCLANEVEFVFALQKDKVILPSKIAAHKEVVKATRDLELTLESIPFETAPVMSNGKSIVITAKYWSSGQHGMYLLSDWTRSETLVRLPDYDHALLLSHGFIWVSPAGKAGVIIHASDPKKEYNLPKLNLKSISLAQDGKRWAGADNAGKIHIGVVTANKLQPLNELEGSVGAVATLLEEGNTLIITTQDGLVVYDCSDILNCRVVDERAGMILWSVYDGTHIFLRESTGKFSTALISDEGKIINVQEWSASSDVPAAPSPSGKFVITRVPLKPFAPGGYNLEVRKTPLADKNDEVPSLPVKGGIRGWLQWDDLREEDETRSN